MGPPDERSTVPDVGFWSPARILSRVDFPDPLGPVMQRDRPVSTDRLMFLNTACRPNFLARSLTVIVYFAVSIVPVWYRSVITLGLLYAMRKRVPLIFVKYK